MRYAARIDGNSAAIVDALRKAGASVYHIKLPVDLLVGYRGVTMLVEIKNPETRYGRAGANGNQREFMSTWNGGAVALVDSPEAALTAIGAIKEWNK